MNALSKFVSSKKNRPSVSFLFLVFILNACGNNSNTSFVKSTTYPLQQLSDSIQLKFQALTNNSFIDSDSGMVALAVYLMEEDMVLADTTYFFSNNYAPLPNEHTVFQMGSVTKTFTAALIARQVNLGNMSLNSPVQSYLPDPKDAFAPVLPTSYNGKPVTITLGDLMTMSSGLTRNARIDPATGTTPYPYAFSYIDNTTLLYDPGSECNIYSNLGFGIGGLTISFQTYPDISDYYNYYEKVLIDSLLSPMEMNHTSITLDSVQKEKRALPYARNGFKSSYNNPNWPMNLAAGGLYSTLNDMQKYAKNMVGEGTFLNTQDLDTLLATRGYVWSDTCRFDRNHYGALQAMGWVINNDMKDSNGSNFARFSKDGGLAGFSTYITFSKPKINGVEYKAYVVLWANRSRFSVQSNAYEVQQLLYELIPD